MLNQSQPEFHWSSYMDVTQGKWQAWVLMPSLLLLLFVVVDRVLLGVAHLDSSAYFQPIIAQQLALRVLTNPKILVLVVAILILFVWQRRALCTSWQLQPDFLPLRLLTMLCALLLGWDFSSYAYNSYFDQAHLVDRILLLAMLPLIWWRPIFIVPFVLLCGAIIWQFNEPIGGYSWAQHYMPIRLLMLIVCAYAVGATLNISTAAPCTLVALCLVASHYWVPGIGKFRLGWESMNAVSYLIPTTYANGWLGWLSTADINALTQLAKHLDGLIRIFVLALEWLVLFLLWRRKLTVLFLGAWIAFHLGIWSYSGILFWKWIAIDAGLAYMLVSRRLPEVYNPIAFVVSIALIAGGSIWFRPVNLAWLDVPINYSYRIMATTEHQATVRLPPKYFAPYDYQFTLGALNYLKPEPHLGLVWGGSASPAIAAQLYAATTTAEVLEIEAQQGRSYLNIQRQEAFVTFLKQFLSVKQNKNAPCFECFSPPRQLWTFPKTEGLQPQEKITQVTVLEVLTFFDGVQYQEIRVLPVVTFSMSEQR